MQSTELEVQSADGHQAALIARIPDAPRASLLWLPALGIAARHYIPLAEALAARGIAVYLHEWRGNGSSSVRAGAGIDWGYRELLDDIDASSATSTIHSDGLPRLAGGHSLGGQLACCFAGQNPDAVSGLWLVASGTPYWLTFPAPRGWLLPLVYRFLPWLAARRGALPGRTIGFGGNEARSLIADWARSAISGHYAAAGLDTDLEAGMARLALPVHAAVLVDDWLAPASSTRFLLSKLPHAPADIARFDRARAGTAPDHYAWMKQPAAIADWLASGPAATSQPAP